MKTLIREYTYEACLFDKFMPDFTIEIEVDEDDQCRPVNHLVVVEAACALFRSQVIKDIEYRTAILPTYGVPQRWAAEEAEAAAETKGEADFEDRR